MNMTRIDIYNLALGNIKVGERVSSIDDETTRRFMLPQNYDVTLASLMAMHDWSFAAVSAKLAAVTPFTPETTPAAMWRYGWAYPADAVKILSVGLAIDVTDPEALTNHLIDPAGNPRPEPQYEFEFLTPRPWDVWNGKGGKIIRTEHDNACARYLSNAVPEANWPASFVAAFTWAMASNITRAVNAQDADADYRMKQAEYYFQQAIRADVDEMGQAHHRHGDWIEARRSLGYRPSLMARE